MRLEEAPLAKSLKYPWQEALLDALKEDKPERWPGKLADAERAVSARLIQEVADSDETACASRCCDRLGVRKGSIYVALTDSPSPEVH